MTEELPAPVLYVSLGLTVLIVVAWLVSLFLNPFLAQPVTFPEWVLSAIMGASAGLVTGRYGRRRDA